ncbi:MAG: hypothetical protein EHM58_08860 [Ignavibacteriae bacterium]|nr:MAG: hypothetical protein EHM58_08860 [Ignavibacteriota bacterium]
MKLKIILFLLIILSSQIYTRDTTVVIDLNYDRAEENIKFSSNENGKYILRINKKSLEGQFAEGYDASIEIIDMDRNDNLCEIIVKGYGSSDYMECFFYQFVNGEIVQCGYLPGNFGVNTTGNKILEENIWMGFYSIDFRHKFDSKNKTLSYIMEDVYDINVPAEVTKSFNILNAKYDNSNAVKTLQPKTKISLIKVDITPKCLNDETDYKYDDNCDWFLIKTEDGFTGWCRLKDFRDNVDGLIWAG